MASVHVDPEKLRDFSRHLKEMASSVTDLIDELSTHLNRLGSTWMDQEYQAFAGQLRVTQSWLRIFVKETEQVIPSLERDAETMAQYQRIQTPR
jgi:hypothetical protein